MAPSGAIPCISHGLARLLALSVLNTLHILRTLRHAHSSAVSYLQIGFFGLILVEAITGKGFLQMIGIQVGRGIGFEI